MHIIKYAYNNKLDNTHIKNNYYQLSALITDLYVLHNVAAQDVEVMYKVQ